MPLLSPNLEDTFNQGAFPRGGVQYGVVEPARHDAFDAPNPSQIKPPKTPADRSVPIERGAWTPFWLHWAVVLAFGVLFLSLLAALIILRQYAEEHNGISTEISSNHYYWTYGPTALLIIVVALWRQVDYTCRRLTPWEELSNKNSSTGLLLDYISPFLLTSFYRAIKFRHWSVVSSLAGFMLLKLITIFSTGLLELSSTLLSSDGVHLQALPIISAEPLCDAGYCSLTNLTIDPVLEYIGILNSRLPYPQGTTSESAFEMVGIPKTIPDGAIITANVPGFYPKFDCQVATIHNNSGFPSRYDFVSSHETPNGDNLKITT